MPAKSKELAPELVQQFIADRQVLNRKQLVQKYHVSRETICRWAKQLGCPKKKKIFSKATGDSYNPNSIIKGYLSDDIRNDPGMQQLLKEFKDTSDNDILSDEERNARLVRIAQKCIVQHIATMTSRKEVIEDMAGMIKLTLYQMKINNEGKDQEEIDKVRLKAIRKQAVNEALEDIQSFLNDAQKGFFNMCLRVATKAKLAARKEAREAVQGHQAESGVTDAEFTEG